MQSFRLVLALVAIIIYIFIFPHVINRYKSFIEKEQSMIQQIANENG